MTSVGQQAATRAAATGRPQGATVPRRPGLPAPESAAVLPGQAPGARRKRSDEVAERIVSAIRSGTWAAGEQLPSEVELARLLNVGRPAVREALFLLKHRGLVAISNGARARVTTPTPDFLIGQLSEVATNLAGLPGGQKHLEQTRLIFESGLAWLAAQNATPGDIARLRAALEANREALGHRDAFVATDVAFHYELARIAQNPIFEAIHSVLVGWLVEQRTTTISLPDADRMSYRDHAAICEAVAAGDPARAYHAMASHLRLISRLFEEATRLRETVLREAARNVADRTGRENAEIWRASFAGAEPPAGHGPGRDG